jgi:hypothetical protein
MGHELPRRQHGRCGSKTPDSGQEGGQLARLKRAISGLMQCKIISEIQTEGPPRAAVFSKSNQVL